MTTLPTAHDHRMHRGRSRLGASVRICVALALISGAVLLGALPADAQTQPLDADDQERLTTDVACDGSAEPGVNGFVDVIEVNGFIDPLLVDFIEERVADADANEVRQLVLQMDSKGAAVDDREIGQLARVLRDAETPIAIWVGPSGSELQGASAQLASVADTLGIANGSEIGRLGPPVLPADEFDGFGDARRSLTDEMVDADDAVLLDLIETPTPILGEFLLTLDVVDFCQNTSDEGEVSTVPLTTTRFFKLSFLDQQLHSVSSAPVAYLLFLSGLALLVFEFFTAGVGIAGVVGAVCFLLGSFGFGVLPTRPWAIALLVASALAYAIDVQVGLPRFWSVVGSISLLIGSLFLYEGVFMGFIPLIAGLAGMALAMMNGMPAMVRTRFSTPTIGRDWLIGKIADTHTAVDPEGTVLHEGAMWPAVVNRATPVERGQKVRIVGIDRNVLEVEPLDGAAKDYRERRNKVSDESGDNGTPTASGADGMASGAEGDGGKGSPQR